jgi:hypothetical protein
MVSVPSVPSVPSVSNARFLDLALSEVYPESALFADDFQDDAISECSLH